MIRLFLRFAVQTLTSLPRRCHNSSMDRKRAFTLTEVLIVTTTVTSLSVGTYAVMGKAKETECLNNLRQLGQAVMMLAQDQGSLPAAKFFPSGAGDQRGIHSILRSYGASGKVLFCPAVPVQLNGSGTNYIWNDVMNGRDYPGEGST